MHFLALYPVIFNVSNYISLLIALVAIIGDNLVYYSNLHLFKALFDNATHAVIGGLSWLFVCLKYKSSHHTLSLLEIALCTVVSSVIDLDHFFAAGSIHLKDATNLPKRPPLHSSTFPIVFCSFLLLLSYVSQIVICKRIALIILTAFLSHHTRDATRRGFWFAPFGSTPAIPYGFYVLLTCLIPKIICHLHSIIHIDDVIQYKFSSNVSVI